ncbi:MAG: T9SS type A sorting domain-containing protein [Chitinophagales bacterium]|nr:T9SS type A sorting domain-containing protein [Chitinophagales bacterium]
MAKYFYLLFFSCFLLSAQGQFSYVYFQNNTPLQLTTRGTQTGGSLASNRWWTTSDTIRSWEKTKQVMWMSRDAGITNGVDFFFTLVIKKGTDSVSLKIKLNGNAIGSDMWISSSIPGLTNPWYFDNAFHENTFSMGGKSYTLKFESYFTGGYDDIRYVLHENNPYLIDTVFTNKATNFSLLAYNIYMLTPPIATTDQAIRGSELANYVHGYDAIILSEAFYNSVRDNNLIPGLSVEYPYHTSVVDQAGAAEDGGVMVFSKYPIEKEAQMNYADCDGTDCLSAKGVMYAKINKNGRKYHVFATHTQAWNDAVDVDVRVKQFNQLRTFLTAQNIARSEAVLVGGDLNVDKIVNNLNEYYRMFDSLKAIEPNYSGALYSYDVAKNNYASSGQEFLDYVLPIKNYFVPFTTDNEVRVIRSKTDDLFYKNDLSDHFALHGKMEYPYIITEPMAQNVCEGMPLILVTQPSHPMYYTWLKNYSDSSITVNNDTLYKANTLLSDSGKYSCNMQYANGGSLFSDTVVIYVTKRPKLLVSNPAPVCFPQTIDLSATFSDTANTTGAVTYWKDSMCTIPSSSIVSQSGTYYIKKTTTINSCVSANKITTTIFPAVTSPDITQIGNVLASNLGSGNQWYSVSDGLIVGATDSTFTPISNGSFYVVYHHSNCGDFYSDTINFMFNGLTEMANDITTSIYPNPAVSKITVTSAIHWLKLEVEDVSGRVVYESDFSDNMNVSTETWAKGLYVVKLYKDDQFLRRKLIVQ